MKLTPLQQWICDSCGELIQSPEEGWVEWVRGEGDKCGEFKIVHQLVYSPRKPRKGCYHHTNRGGRLDIHLSRFIGPEGLIELYAFLDPAHGPGIADMGEFIELMRRLTIIYYEEARLYWNKALSDGFGANEISIYLPENLKEMIEEYGTSSTLPFPSQSS